MIERETSPTNQGAIISIKGWFDVLVVMYHIGIPTKYGMRTISKRMVVSLFFI
jgi:hypothetical protein